MYGLSTIKKMNKKEQAEYLVLQARKSSLQVYRTNPDTILPTRATAESAGIDLYLPDNILLPAFQKTLVKLGLVIRPPTGYHTEILIRSSLAKKGVILANSIGIIDRDYAGPNDELGLLLIYIPNYAIDSKPLVLLKNDRIAQLLLRKSELDIPILEVDNPPLTNNRGGFGSTGV